MALFDLKNRIATANSLVPLLRTTTANGTGVDVANTGGVDIVWTVGAITDGTHTPSIEESDASGSGFAAVAAADLIGTLTALVANTNQEVGYRGTKRYVRAVITVTGSPGTGGTYGAVVITSGHRKQPA